MRPDPSHASLTYRPEVDGLRALAVLPVIFFHAGFETFSGGFVGVDVFFVISGYLITSIILNDLHQGNFSIGRFYERRARRILPALFLVIAACIPFAWLMMLPVEMQAFASSSIAALGFVPNVYFWLTANYFAPAAEQLPLLHTWSLGVEEQFYLLFPLLLWWGRRLRLRTLAAATALFALVSFGLSEWAWRSGRFSSNFFLTPTRAWELMLGALLAMAWRRGPIYVRLSRVTNELASITGVLMLCASVVLFDKSTPTPSVYALLPTVGTCLLIACAGPQTLMHSVLSHRWLVGVGLVSYSAYLWHQPLFAFARLFVAGEPPGGLMLALAASALALAYLTWRFVETPFRRSRSVSVHALVRVSVASWLALLSVSVVIERTGGFSTRIPPEDRELADLADPRTAGRRFGSRFLALQGEFTDGSAGRRVLIVGDSYAEDLVNAIAEGGQLAGFEIRTFRVPPECQIVVGPRDVSQHVPLAWRSTCERVRESRDLLGRVRHADVIFLAASWREWSADALPESLRRFDLRPAQKVFVVGPKRVGTIDVRKLLRMPLSERVQVSESFAPRVVAMEERLLRLVPEGGYVSMQTAICGPGPDCKLFTPEGQLASFDGTHLTAAGAAMAGRNLFAVPPLVALQVAKQ